MKCLKVCNSKNVHVKLYYRPHHNKKYITYHNATTPVQSILASLKARLEFDTRQNKLAQNSLRICLR